MHNIKTGHSKNARICLVPICVPSSDASTLYSSCPLPISCNTTKIGVSRTQDRQFPRWRKPIGVSILCLRVCRAKADRCVRGTKGLERAGGQHVFSHWRSSLLDGNPNIACYLPSS